MDLPASSKGNTHKFIVYFFPLLKLGKCRALAEATSLTSVPCHSVRSELETFNWFARLTHVYIHMFTQFINIFYFALNISLGGEVAAWLGALRSLRLAMTSGSSRFCQCLADILPAVGPDHLGTRSMLSLALKEFEGTILDCFQLEVGRSRGESNSDCAPALLRP